MPRKFTIHCGDALEVLRTLPDESVNCCVTSPPYWGLRDYGVAGQLGLEQTPEEYVARMVEVFREVRRVLLGDGTLWLNLGDSYANAAIECGRNDEGRKAAHGINSAAPIRYMRKRDATAGVKSKDLVGVPWMVAFALRADGWYLRSEIIWAKPNPMPESVTDRPTKAHEQVFLLAKSERYYYDAEAIKEPVNGTAHFRGNGVNPKCVKVCGRNSRIFQDRDPQHPSARKIKQNESFSAAVAGLVNERNKRSVWTIATEAFPEAHFATYPTALVKPCIKAGCPEGGTVLDPFAGSGTTGLVALRLGRLFVGIELNPEYAEMARRRIVADAPLAHPEEPQLMAPITGPLFEEAGA